MKLLGYIFLALAVACLIAVLLGHEHQFFMFMISGSMAWAILSEETESDNRYEQS